jgi:hypothetical protein
MQTVASASQPLEPSAPPWPAAHVLALAPDAKAAGAARRIAVPQQWSATGADQDGVWGLYHGSGAEPYQTVVALAAPAFRCSCPSRRAPCKHALALLLLWSAGQVGTGARPAVVEAWLARAVADSPTAHPTHPIRESDADAAADAAANAPPPRARRPRSGPAEPMGAHPDRPTKADQRAIERAERVARGLADLDRWVADCLRQGLTAPALAKYATWDAVAARLVDAQVPALAHRIQRLAGFVGTRPGWHEHVLAELGTLHLVCEAGRRLPTLDPDMADSVRTALGFTVRQADVLARPPETDEWIVCGRSDTLEERIVVRRVWVRGRVSQRWALLLSFAAYGQSLDASLNVGHRFTADLHRYPGRSELRAVLGTRHADGAGGPRHDATGLPEDAPAITTSVAGACDDVGSALASLPWLERWPVTVRAAPAVSGGRWVLSDHTGSLPLAVGAEGVAPLVAVSRGEELAVTAEWTPAGLVTLAAHLGSPGESAHRHVDVGPRGGFHERPPRWAGR